MPSSTSLFLPVRFALPQEPKTAPDTPAGPSQTGGPSTQTPDKPTGTASPLGCGDNTMFLYMGLFLALMYFMVMRPEQKRKKEQQAMMASIKVGDRIVTQGGMHGTVANLTEKTVTLRVDTMKVTFDRAAIARVVRDEPAAGEAPKA
ncbi:MAG: preprotein translocase subunit YajC [Planctomycetota bacterium]